MGKHSQNNKWKTQDKNNLHPTIPTGPKKKKNKYVYIFTHTCSYICLLRNTCNVLTICLCHGIVDTFYLVIYMFLNFQIFCKEYMSFL